jgi:transglutaminase-like putative cysteine protease
MATGVRRVSSPLEQWGRRLRHGVNALFAPGDLTALFIVVVLLLMPVLALNAAGWPLAMNTILPVLIIGIFFGFILARSHYNELIALMMSGIYGGAFVLLIAAINEPGSLGEGLNSVLTRIIRWLTDAVTGGINQDELIFTLLVASLLWFLAYSAVWHVFRIDRVWRAVLPPGLILVSNSVWYAGDANLEIYLVIFMLMSLLLVVRSNLDALEWKWYTSGIRVPYRLHQQFFRMGALLALLALAFAWLIPSADLQERLDRFQEFLQEEPLTQLSEFWNRLFATVDTQGPTTADYYGSDSLQLGGAIRLGDQEVFWVSAPAGHRYYWRSRVFDTYENGRWSPAATTRLTDPQAPLDIRLEPYIDGSRTAVQQEFTLGLRSSRLVYAAPQPARVDLATRSDLSNIGTDDRVINENTPPDVTLKHMNISVIRPTRVLSRGDRYTATSLLSTATAGQLRAVGTNYPAWVSELYLYVSPSITPRTYELARAVVSESGAVTPYDQARALETWLRLNIRYNEGIPQPPVGRDPVDWFLFDIREGYCNYYASAMIMMLRTLGIPARMAAGFAQGTLDPETGLYVVRERDAHTWVEAYFPGYGWIEFEPTAAQAPINRVDDAPQIQQPTPTPQFTPTPTVTPSPTATPTDDPNVVPPQQGQMLPTLTPTATPSPTATPVIIPTQPPPPPPQPRGPLSSLLPLLGMVFMAVLSVILLIALAVFIWWWWEWRGMGGLNPVVRAYARLERYATLLGIRFSDQQTPEERRQQIVRDIPSAEPPVSAITRMYTDERYGPGVRHVRDAEVRSEAADEAWSDTRTTILGRFLRRLLSLRRRR